MTGAGGQRQARFYDYDDAGQLTGIALYDSEAANDPARVMSFTYTPMGLLESYDDGDTAGSYEYDDQGRLTGATTDYGPFSKGIAYSYDAAGRMASYTNPEGITYRYHYTPGGRIERIEIPDEGEISFGERQWHQPGLIQFPGGSRIERRFDGLQRMKENQLLDPERTELRGEQFDYDLVDNILARYTSGGDYQYDYDPLYRLTRAAYPDEEETFGYDGVGNRTQHSKTDEAPETLEPLHYNEANQLIQRGDTEYQYDANGHLIREEGPDEVREYVYDARERLTRVEDGNGATIVRYGYNPFGHRVWKEVNGTRTYFFYNESGLVGEYDASGNLIREYHYKPNQTWMTRPLFMRSGNQVYYYHNDHLGTPQKLIARDGAVVWEAEYEAFGKADVTTEEVVNPLRFPGQYHDPETGLSHNYHRDYDPSLGRYLQADPIGLEGGINVYAYVEGNPINGVDPLGLSPSDGCELSCIEMCEKQFEEDEDFRWEQYMEATEECQYRPGLRSIGNCAVETVPLYYSLGRYYRRKYEECLENC